jgi:acyl carrier protein
MEDFKGVIRNFILQTFGTPGGATQDIKMDIKDDTSLLDNDLMDSTAVLELASFLEDNFGVSIQNDDLVRANVDSINAIAAFVQRKRDDKPAGKPGLRAV